MEDDVKTPEQIAAEEAAAKKAEDEAAAKAAEDEAAAKAAEAAKNKKPTDTEAQLLKDVMKQKAAAKAAKEELDALKARFEGIDPDAVRKLLADQAAAEEAAALARGEFDSVKAQMVERHKTDLAARETRIAELEASIAASAKTIEDLTVGVSFGSSAFVAEELVLPAAKARALYGAHFDIVDGAVVGYDKPRGVEGRAPLVDGAGDNLGFDEAFRKIIGADPDKDKLLKTTLKPGGGGQQTKLKTPAAPAEKSRQEKVAEGIAAMMAAKKK